MTDKIFADNIRARLKELGTNPTAASLAIGKHKDFLKDILSGKSRSSRLETLQAVARACQWTLDMLLQNVTLEGIGGHPTPEPHSPTPEPTSDINSIPVWGEVAAGVWIEENGFEVDVSEMETIPVVPDQRFAKYRQYALRVRGESMNKIIQDGEYAVCVDVATIRTWVDGDVVVVVRRRYGGHMRETTIKQVSITPEHGLQLWPRSDDPRFQEPIQLKNGDGDTVEIAALVIAKHASLLR